MILVLIMGNIAMLTNNYVSADIQLIVNDAARSALKAHSKITMNFFDCSHSKYSSIFR